MNYRMLFLFCYIALVVLFIGWNATISWADNSIFLDNLLQDTWTYLSSDWATDNHLPWSWRSAITGCSGGDYANPTEIGLYALSWIGAYEAQKPWSPAWAQVEAEVVAVLDQLRAWQSGSQLYQPHGSNAYANSVFYQWYWINWSPPVVGANTGTNQVVPSVDNAWLAASLITIREYGEVKNHPGLSQKANAILNDMDFTPWYDTSTHRFLMGGVQNPQNGLVWDYYSNENRIINFVARALGHLSSSQFRLSLDALEGSEGTYNSITVKQMAWDGSLFTYLTPALFIREIDTPYSTNTIIPAIEAQIAYATDKSYPVWGLSDCFDVTCGPYINQGAPPAATPDPLETHFGVITPHASALALITVLSSSAVSNLQSIVNMFPSSYESGRGFRDSVMVKSNDSQYGVPSSRFSALAQEWIFLSIVNAETNFIWQYFYHDGGVIQAHKEMFPEAYLLWSK